MDPTPHLATTIPSCVLANQHFVSNWYMLKYHSAIAKLDPAGLAMCPSHTLHYPWRNATRLCLVYSNSNTDFPFRQVVCIRETQVLKIRGLALPLTRASLKEACTAACTFTGYFKGHYYVCGKRHWHTVLLHRDADPALPLTPHGLPLQKQPLHAQYLPFLVSCCRMFLIKWTFLKFFGLGDPESVRHLKNKSVGGRGEGGRKSAQFPAVRPRSLHKGRKERRDKWFKTPCVRNGHEQ